MDEPQTRAGDSADAGADVRATTPAPGAVTVRVALDPRVNFALQQNAVPFVKRVVVDNRSGRDLVDVVVEVTTSPEVTERFEARIDRVPSATERVLAPVDVRLRPEVLVAQHEREAGTLRVRVTAAGETVAETAADFEVLAYDEWNGTASLPEILAAFVLPNHPEVERILGAARDLLGERTGNPSLEGYQARDPRRVLAVAEAIWDAVRAMGLTYATPPASFETQGQKVRTPDRIAESRMATCLDLALLFAACLEQAGLNALVVLVKEHAFAGVWLVDDSFPETATTEPWRILKRVELDAIRVFETTGAASRPQLAFADALREGRRRLEDVDRFLFSVDVKGARRARVRPIPLRGAPGAVAVVPEIRAVGDARGVDDDPAAGLRPPRDPSAAAADDAATPGGRLARWKRKLLDLTLRNRLLNHRETKQTVPLLLPDLAAIEDALAGGRALEVCPKPDVLGDDDPRDAEVHRARTGEDGLRAYLAEELKARRVHASLGGDELTVRLLEISRAARLSLEEGGANTLYLAVGFLAWYETPASAEPRLAPILLVPVALDRRTALDTFRLRLLDDDPRVNATLVQKLHAEYGLDVQGVDPLPEDDAGVDVAAVLRAFREAVLPLPRWHVRDDAVLGIFSFTKYLMWLDLEARRDVLARNDVVRRLIDGTGAAVSDTGTFPDETRLDDDRDPAATFCPLDADSSQLSAVFAAADGRTFVLQGPPGTGKSQTITNLIAQCLATGRRVLFVSEKMAALDVVHRRLERVGVGPFCLPLHSNKAQKKDVLDRIAEALALGAQAAPATWEARARELADVRAQLNRTARALHAPRWFGLTAYRTIARLIGLRDEHASEFQGGEPRKAPADLPARVRVAAQTLAAEARETGGVPGHPLAAVRLDRWAPEVDADARRLAAELIAAAGKVDAAAAPVAQSMGLAARAWSADDLARIAEWCALLADAPKADVRGLVTAIDWDAARAEAAAAVAAGRDRGTRRTRLFASFRPQVLDAPLDAWDATLRAAQASWALPRWWKGRGVRRDMDALRTGAAPGGVADADRIRDLEESIALRDLSRDLSAPSSDGARLFGASWNGGEADWAALDAGIAWAGRCRELLARTAGPSVDDRVRLRDTWLRLVSEGRDLFLRDGRLTGTYAAFPPALAAHSAARGALSDRLRLDDDAAFGTPAAEGAVARAVATAGQVAANVHRLRAWCGWQRARAEAAALGLGPLCRDVESGAADVDRLVPAAERAFHAWLLARVLAADPVLADFSSTRQGLAIERFRELDREILDATVGVVRARLAAALPRQDPNVAAGSEMGILQREIQKKTRHMPLRRLFEKIPNALARVKPCLLMSPLSVAQYLSPEHPAFDVVVFDEASQIPVWDAIGAVARGARLVVVGDTKQLPPTSFFEKEESEQSLDEDDVEDLESILDECCAAGLPERTLDWHYRSRHESLIAFSNRHYYGDRLLTFPSAEAATARLGVSLRPVPDGVYDKGRTRANRREAEELVADLVRRLRDPAEARRSVGVVTFSMAQQTLVEDLLEAERRRHPEIEPFFSSDRQEPVFVKNLENVQGDERDVILFSVCYGPDAQRRVYMNFGPLNRAGGERRLNVAITRAREQVVVFSTLRADQVDLARTRAVGVADLKAFLDYAERGTASLGDAGGGPTGADRDSPFEEAVERALVARGHEVHRQVGCSGYRIDLAVADPVRPGRYLLGIECDGASYHSGHTARDRDRLRAAVLRGLGWTLHRVWSTDWWYEPGRETARIEEAIGRAREEAAASDAAPAAPSPETPAASDALPGGASIDPRDPPDPPEGPSQFASGVSEPPPPGYVPAAPSSSRADIDYPVLLGGPLRGTPERFVLAVATDEVARTLRDIVDVEAPILLDLAVRRVAALWGVQRVTARAAERVESVVRDSGAAVTSDDGETLLWRPGDDPAAFAGFRRPRDASSPERAADQIPLVELVHAVRWVLESQLGAPVEDVARDTARLFGIARLGSQVRERMERAVAAAAARGLCTVEAGFARLAP